MRVLTRHRDLLESLLLGPPTVGVAVGTMCFGSCQVRIQSTVTVWGRFFFSSRSGSLDNS
jgi:hypothetical protein